MDMVYIPQRRQTPFISREPTNLHESAATIPNQTATNNIPGDLTGSTSLLLHAGASKTAQQNALQRHAGAFTSVQEHDDAAGTEISKVDKATHSPAPDEPSEFTLSVEDIRLKLYEVGIKKSKDTIQRYCREGELSCRKLGIFNRYFSTEVSVATLLIKLQPDADARGGVQVHEAVPTKSKLADQVHAVATMPTTSISKDLDEAAQTRTQEHEATPTAPDGLVLQALLTAEQDKTKILQEQISFLQEEVRDGRSTRRDVTTIAGRMLETLESMAVGGRVLRAPSPMGNSENDSEHTPNVSLDCSWHSPVVGYLRDVDFSMKICK